MDVDDEPANLQRNTYHESILDEVKKIVRDNVNIIDAYDLKVKAKKDKKENPFNLTNLMRKEFSNINNKNLELPNSKELKSALSLLYPGGTSK